MLQLAPQYVLQLISVQGRNPGQASRLDPMPGDISLMSRHSSYY